MAYLLFSGKSQEKLQEFMDKFIEQLDPYIEHVAEQWLDAGYHIGISLGCCLLGYGAESNVLMRALSQKPEEIDVAAEANADETFKQALGFMTRITETVMRRWGGYQHAAIPTHHAGIRESYDTIPSRDFSNRRDVPVETDIIDAELGAEFP
ncbi:hypothetical protein BHE90_016908 [Fusarium euwallaceae]|uniref:Uncharacterized protein n=1 Tax=Fusarium euwallaceae TaxID=1147111 RepID=A0A430KZ26_9HYPO|nr:hypothetical protein BHE90_016908 [Fusarium euwallaceae]